MACDCPALTKRLFHHFNLPTAKYLSVNKEAQLEKLSHLTFPLVMKPLKAKQGEGVVVGIQDLTEAREHFAQQQRHVLFEEMLQGTEYRVVCVDYKFVAAAKRRAAFVVGDGSNDIMALIDEKNKHPWRGEGHQSMLTTIKADAAMEKLLEKQGYTLKSVPEQGVEVVLRKTGNLSTGGEAWDVTDEVSQVNRELFEEIARHCDLNTIGIDVMCSSLEDPITTQEGAGVIEVNASPGLRMHHFPIQGEPRNIAGMVLDMVERAYFPAK